MPVSNFISSFIAFMWLKSLTTSSSTHILSANKVTSVAILFSSILAPLKSSLTFKVSLLLYSSNTCGYLSLILSAVSVKSSSFEFISVKSFSPSDSLVVKNTLQASSNTLKSWLFTFSSSSLGSSMLITSGSVKRCDTFKSSTIL